MDRNLQICSITYSIKLPENLESEVEDNEQNNVNQENLNFTIIAQDFLLVLQMLWKYMHDIGSVAFKSSIINLAGSTELFNKILTREKKAKPDDKPIAIVDATIVVRNKNNEKKEKSFSAKVFEFEHLELFDEYKMNSHAALRILNESALQQIINAYEKLLGELLVWHFF